MIRPNKRQPGKQTFHTQHRRRKKDVPHLLIKIKWSHNERRKKSEGECVKRERKRESERIRLSEREVIMAEMQRSKSLSRFSSCRPHTHTHTGTYRHIELKGLRVASLA